MDVNQNELVISLEGSNDIAAWINDQLQHSTSSGSELVELAELDKRVGNLVTRLEVLYQDVATNLERTLDSTTRSIPRLALDMQILKDSALNLQSSLHKARAAQDATNAAHVQNDIDIDAVLDKLRHLDLLQSNMKLTRHILQETENWNTIEGEVTNYINTGDIPSFRKAGQRLREAEQGLSLFQDTPEFESRRSLIISLANQLEASLSASLVAAVNSADIPACKDYYDIFQQVDRESEFRTYYNGTRRADIISLWGDTKLPECGEPYLVLGVPPEGFVVFFRRFLSTFEALIGEERGFQSAIFPEPLETISAFIQSLFDALSPSIAQRLQGYSNNNEPRSLLGLIEAYQVAQHTVANVSKIMEKLSFLSSFNANTPEKTDQAEPAATGRPRRLSKRTSMSRRTFSNITGRLISDRTLTWEAAILEPFLEYQSDYGKLEQAYLDEILQSSSLPSTNRWADQRERAFRERAVDVLAAAEEAIARCQAFTSGYGSVGLVQAVDKFLRAFIVTGDSFFSGSVAVGKPSSTTSSAGVPLEDFDYTPQDWASIQTCLRLLEAAKAIFARMQVLDDQLHQFIIQSRNTLFDTRRNVKHNADRADLHLLAQSTLNSMELQSLFQGVSPEQDTTGSQLRLLKQSRASIVSFVERAQGKICKTILGPLYSQINAYPGLSTWTATPESASTTGGLQVPTFSLSPTHTIQRVAEGLLNLPRLFEVHVDDDALAFFIELLPFASTDGYGEEGNPGESQTPGHQSSSYAGSTGGGGGSGETAGAVLTPEQVASAWLSSLTMSLLEHLTTSVLPQIRRMSVSGIAQLETDLSYLSNVVKALNAESAELDAWRDYCGMGEEDGRALVRAGERREDRILSRVAALRGWDGS